MELQQRFPSSRGLSARNVRKYCSVNGIYRSSHLTPSEVNDAVKRAVSLFGPSYGRRTLTGLLWSEGCIVGEQKLQHPWEESLVHSILHWAKAPYYAEYYGHKIHIDQNENLIQFGVIVAVKKIWPFQVYACMHRYLDRPVANCQWKSHFRLIITSEGYETMFWLTMEESLHYSY